MGQLDHKQWVSEVLTEHCALERLLVWSNKGLRMVCSSVEMSNTACHSFKLREGRVERRFMRLVLLHREWLVPEHAARGSDES